MGDDFSKWQMNRGISFTFVAHDRTTELILKHDGGYFLSKSKGIL